MWEMLVSAGVTRCYGIVGDALNPVIDALRRNGKIDFVHVRNEEYGVFAAVAESYLTNKPVVVCGTAGPGVTHLFNGLMDARKERAAVIAIAGDVETSIMDTSSLEEMNPYHFFPSGLALYGALGQSRADPGGGGDGDPDGGDRTGANGDFDCRRRRRVRGGRRGVPIRIPTTPVLRPSDADLDELAEMINDAGTVAIFGGDGCRDARSEVLELAARLKAPVGYALRGKQWLEHDNPYAVGLTGLLGYGGAYGAINNADVLLMLGTDFPFSEFLPGSKVKKVQIDTNPKHIGRRTPLDLGLVGDVKASPSVVGAGTGEDGRSLLEKVCRRNGVLCGTEGSLCREGSGHQADSSRVFGQHFVRTRGGRCDVLRRYGHAGDVAGAPYQGWHESPAIRIVLMGVDGERGSQCVRGAARVPWPQDDCDLRRWGIHDAGDGRFVDAGGEEAHVVHILLNNGSLDFVSIEQQEGGFIPFGLGFKNPNFAAVAEAMGAKGIRIEDPGDVRDGLLEALAHRGGPVVVDVLVDPYALAMPSHVPFHTMKGYTLSMAKQVVSGRMDSIIETIEHNVRLV